MRRAACVFLLVAIGLAGCADPSSPDDPDPTTGTPDPSTGPPVVGVIDIAVNPYHEVFRRADATEHPCRTWPQIPCDLPALDLSLDAGLSLEEAVAKDAAVWASAEEGAWYWIPGTVFLAVADFSCPQRCLLPDPAEAHGTWTASIIAQDAPEAHIIFAAYNETSLELGPRDPMADAPLRPDVMSVSLGSFVPTPAPVEDVCDQAHWFVTTHHPLMVKSAGNQPGLSILTDCWSGDPAVISVGGAHAPTRRQELLAFKDMDVVSSFCRPIADAGSRTAFIEGGTLDTLALCGTSLAAPTVAAGLARTIYLARAEGLDPTPKELRAAVNASATYLPEVDYTTGPSADGLLSVPLNDAAPWLQWGWGFFDVGRAEAALAALQGGPDTVHDDARTHMAGLIQARQALYGR